MPGIADLMEGVNQILVLGIQHQVEVGSSISGRVAQALPSCEGIATPPTGPAARTEITGSLRWWYCSGMTIGYHRHDFLDTTRTFIVAHLRFGLTPGSFRDCKLETPLRKRRSRVSIADEFSVKRQRVSEAIGTIDVYTDAEKRQEYADINSEPRMTGSFSSLTRQTSHPTVKGSPRCAGALPNRSSNISSRTYRTTVTVHPRSRWSWNTPRPLAYPLSWSSTNVITVAGGHDVYYQDLDTRQIAHLYNLPRPSLGRIQLRTTTGCVEVWDAASRRHCSSHPPYFGRSLQVHSIWQGATKGRSPAHDERFMVSADAHGTIHLWDARTMSTRVGEMKHRQGSGVVPLEARSARHARGWYLDGWIHIWSASSLANNARVPNSRRFVSIAMHTKTALVQTIRWFTTRYRKEVMEILRHSFWHHVPTADVRSSDRHFSMPSAAEFRQTHPLRNVYVTAFPSAVKWCSIPPPHIGTAPFSTFASAPCLVSLRGTMQQQIMAILLGEAG
ncbi:hypothetical protein EDB84DRAFT_1437852 [Lactarius hengduanensis]|nr:hypothetical protein EDB84DRAFT_1437852 [Lactarius hengduanensis]